MHLLTVLNVCYNITHVNHIVDTWVQIIFLTLPVRRDATEPRGLASMVSTIFNIMTGLRKDNINITKLPLTTRSCGRSKMDTGALRSISPTS
jgi:hypothetical protein